MTTSNQHKRHQSSDFQSVREGLSEHEAEYGVDPDAWDALQRIEEQLEAANSSVSGLETALEQSLDREESLQGQLKAQGRRLDAVRLERDTLEREKNEQRKRRNQTEEALRRIAADVHLVLSDHYSGLWEERRDSIPAYARLTVIVEEDEDRVRDVDGIVTAALDPIAAGYRPKEYVEDMNGELHPVSNPAFGPRIQNDSDPTRRVSGASPEGDDGDTGAETPSPAIIPHSAPALPSDPDMSGALDNESGAGAESSPAIKPDEHAGDVDDWFDYMNQELPGDADWGEEPSPAREPEANDA